MKQTVRCLLAIVATTSVTTSSPVNLSGQQVEATALWERMIEAKGGRKQLHQIQTLVVESKRNGFGRKGLEMISVFAFPGKRWHWVHQHRFSDDCSVGITNVPSHRFWSRHCRGTAPLVMTLREYSLRLELIEEQLVYLLETAWVKPTPMRVSREGVPRNTVALYVEHPEFHSIEYIVDTSSYLVRQVAAIPLGEDRDSRAGMWKRYFFDRYRIVDGIQMPGREADLGELSFILNPNLDPRLFEGPPTDVMNRDAWKAYLHK